MPFIDSGGEQFLGSLGGGSAGGFISSLGSLGGLFGGGNSGVSQNTGIAQLVQSGLNQQNDTRIAQSNNRLDQQLHAGSMGQPDREGSSSSLAGTVAPISQFSAQHLQQTNQELLAQVQNRQLKGQLNWLNSNQQPQSSMQQLGQFAKQTGGGILQNLAQGAASKVVNTGLNRLLRPDVRVPDLPRQVASGRVSGAQQKAYMDAAFPGTNPWERLGSSASGGGVAGGQGAALIGERSQENVAGIHGRAQVDSAHISSLPNLKKVEYQFQKLPNEVQQMQASANRDLQQAHVGGAQVGQITATTENQKQVNRLQKTFQGISQQMKTAQISTLTAEAANKMQQVAESTMRMPLIAANTQIREVIARWAELLVPGAGIAKIAAGAATIGGLLWKLTGRGGAAAALGTIKGTGKIKNWPRYGPAAGQTY